MKKQVRLLLRLPIAKEHGAEKGRVFDCTRVDGRKAWFIGDASEECAAFLSYECEVFEEGGVT